MSIGMNSIKHEGLQLFQCQKVTGRAGGGLHLTIFQAFYRLWRFAEGKMHSNPFWHRRSRKLQAIIAFALSNFRKVAVTMPKNVPCIACVFVQNMQTPGLARPHSRASREPELLC